ncbi:hypothetical protein [Nocardia sp. NBC_00416]|uniref:hypothetical protein n=1 Tax=Nocardia sp. NBC_00416 TaxID=2975991 RepID=UPI002E1AC7AA
MRRVLVTGSTTIAIVLGSVTGTAAAGTGVPLGTAPVQSPGVGTGSADALAMLFYTLSGIPDPCAPIVPVCIPPRVD